MKNTVVAVMAVVILGFCAWGFGDKFYQFVILATKGEEEANVGIFAVTPIVNYLLASFGFLLLLGWAAANGMFRDIEGPKQTMLDHEAQLDRGRDDAHCPDSIL